MCIANKTDQWMLFGSNNGIAMNDRGNDAMRRLAKVSETESEKIADWERERAANWRWKKNVFMRWMFGFILTEYDQSWQSELMKRSHLTNKQHYVCFR